MHAHQTTLDLMGAARPAIIRYTPDPVDGYPAIEAVEIARALNSRCEPSDAFRENVEHIVLDILPVLDAADLLRIEQELCEARPLWRGCA